MKLRDLFTEAIWNIDTAPLSKGQAELVKVIKLIRATLKTFFQNRMGFQCVALSYFVTLALFPLIAFIFAVTGTLGLSVSISDFLYRLFPGNIQFVDTLLERAMALIESAKGGGPALVSALFFLFAVIWMMFQVERVFNNVWGIRKIPRKLYKRLGFYLIMLFLAPFLTILFGTGIAYYSNVTKLIGLDLSDVRFISQLLGTVIFYIITMLTLSAMYKWIPAANVKYIYALRSAKISAAFFVLFQYLYLETQVFVGRLNGAYGLIAAFPLFLIWLNISWQIIIYGASLTYGYHNIEDSL